MQSDFWLVSGTIDDDTVQIGPVVEFNTMGPGEPNEPTGATHVVAVLDDWDDPLFWRFFQPSSSQPLVIGGGHATGPGIFTQLLPVHPDGTRIVIADANQVILAERQLGGVAPRLISSRQPAAK